MKKLVMMGVLSCVLCVSGYANNGWGLFAGYWDPADGEGSVGPGLKISIEMVPEVQLNLRTAYFDDMGKDENGATVDLQVIPIEGDLALNINFAKSNKGYVGIGMGYYMVDNSVELADGTKPDVDSDSKIGYYAVAGMEYGVVENGALFIEAKYTAVSIDDIKVGSDGSLSKGDLNGLGVNAGIMVTW